MTPLAGLAHCTVWPWQHGWRSTCFPLVCVSLLLVVPAEEFDESVVPALPKAKLAPTRGAAYKVLATLCGGTPDNLASLMQRLSSLVAQTTKVGVLSRALPRSAMTLVGGGAAWLPMCVTRPRCVLVPRRADGCR